MAGVQQRQGEFASPVVPLPNDTFMSAPPVNTPSNTETANILVDLFDLRAEYHYRTRPRLTPTVGVFRLAMEFNCGRYDQRSLKLLSQTSSLLDALSVTLSHCYQNGVLMEAHAVLSAQQKIPFPRSHVIAKSAGVVVRVFDAHLELKLHRDIADALIAYCQRYSAHRLIF